MFLASRILGIPGLEVERVHRRNGVEIWARPFHRPSCLYCGSDRLRIVSFHPNQATRFRVNAAT
jgi:hypothetical protein